jgi:hypothetical protein
LIVALLAGFEKQVEGLEFRRMFSGEMDANHAFLDIQSGSGGTEAQDWAAMTSIRKSAGLISISILSSISGETKTEAKDV